jgi:hypothetical protein
VFPDGERVTSYPDDLYDGKGTERMAKTTSGWPDR